MSKENPLQKYGVAAISDVLSCFGVPTAVGLQIYSDVLQTRSDEAFEILLSEVRQGHFKNIDQHEVVSIIARFQRDAMEGVARNNLRIMARIINGMAERQELRAPSFLRYANILSALSEEELCVLSVMAKHASGNLSYDLFSGEEKENEIEKLDNPGRHELETLIPNYISIQQSLLRTGLIAMSVKSKSPNDIGSVPLMGAAETLKIETVFVYNLTPLMKEVLNYTSFIIDDKDR